MKKERYEIRCCKGDYLTWVANSYDAIKVAEYHYITHLEKGHICGVRDLAAQPDTLDRLRGVESGSGSAGTV